MSLRRPCSQSQAAVSRQIRCQTANSDSRANQSTSGAPAGGRARVRSLFPPPTPPPPCTPLDLEFATRGFELGSCTTADSATHGCGTEERLDPYSLRPMKLLTDHICTHHQLVLFSQRMTDSGLPKDFLVYSYPFLGKGATLVKLPKVMAVPKISSSQWLGLLRDNFNCEKYVVANLQIGDVEVSLHRWYPSSSSWSSELVVMPSNMGNLRLNMGKWRTDQVIPCNNNLLWVDHRLGILSCNNPLGKNDAKFDFIAFPLDLPQKWVRRPETVMRVDCCNGKLKLVVLDISDVNTIVRVTIRAFNDQSKCWDTISQFSLDCTELWDVMKLALQLPSYWKVSENYMPCLPVLSTSRDKDILCLTMARKDNKHAWLLQVGMEEARKDNKKVGTEARKDNKVDKLDTEARNDNKFACLLQVDTESDTESSTESDTESSRESGTESSPESIAQVCVTDYLGFWRHQRPPFPLAQSETSIPLGAIRNLHVFIHL